MISLSLFLVILSLISIGQANDGCLTRSIRLVDGMFHNFGRVETCLNYIWGTVCSEGWTERDAGHVCSRLGYPAEGATIASHGEGSGSVYNITCPENNIDDDCRRGRVTPSNCNHSLDLGVKCQTFLMACKTENNETLSSLTTPPPVECPTPPPTMNTTPIQCQYSTQPPNMETMPVQCTTIPPTGSMNNNTAPNEGSCGSVVLGLIFSVIILIAILLLALVGWIVTCVRSQIRIYKLIKGHTRPLSPSDTAYELNNPVYETGRREKSTTPPQDTKEDWAS